MNIGGETFPKNIFFLSDIGWRQNIAFNFKFQFHINVLTANYEIAHSRVKTPWQSTVFH